VAENSAAGLVRSWHSCQLPNPPKHIFLLENHDEAFYIWQNAKVTHRVLVHIDAHHDMWWINDNATITIANFICPALKQDFVSEVIWVVPYATFANSNNTRSLVAQVNALLKDYPIKSRTLVKTGDRIIGSILGKQLIICTLRSIPTLHDNVLLDIDVDYLIIPRVTYEEYDNHDLFPWCWPCELVEELQGIRSDLITVAYSVEGGYTPLQWKYLGDELALRLNLVTETDSRLEGMEQIRQGAEAEALGDVIKAELRYRAASNLLPVYAAPLYRLARLLKKQRRIDEGRQAYQKAVDLDSSYRGAYSSAGFHFYWNKQYKAAELEFREIQALNPQDPHAHLGLGLLAKRRERWDHAERHLNDALEIDECLVDAQYALAEVLVEKGEKERAINAYERALSLGLKGYKPLSGPILTHAGTNRILDPFHRKAYVRLSTLYEQSGSTGKAANALRISMAGSADTVTSRLRLARLYVKMHRWRNAAWEILHALRILPKRSAETLVVSAKFYGKTRTGIWLVLRKSIRVTPT
jgi:tetratricopeptide (TPR) repeat protein